MDRLAFVQRRWYRLSRRRGRNCGAARCNDLARRFRRMEDLLHREWQRGGAVFSRPPYDEVFTQIQLTGLFDRTALEVFVG